MRRLLECALVLSFLLSCAGTRESKPQACPTIPLDSAAPVSVKPSVPTPLAVTIVVTPRCNVSALGFDHRVLGHCIDSLLAAGQVDSALALLRVQVNPHNSIGEQGRRTLQLVKLLEAQGKRAEAREVLEAFLVFKPAIQEWLDSAEALDRAERNRDSAQAETYSSLVRQISNLMMVKSDYGMVRPLTDSLRTFPLADSLQRWARVQDSIALRRSEAKARAMEDEARRAVLDQADYGKATRIVNDLRGIHPDLAARLGLDTLQAWIGARHVRDSLAQDPTWWKGKDPQAVLLEARKARDEGKLTQAVGLYGHLLQSTQRAQARAELAALEEPFCNQQRQSAVDAFAKARKSKRKDDARKLLLGAVAALDACTAAFPDSPLQVRIQQNRELLTQELSKLGMASPAK